MNHRIKEVIFQIVREMLDHTMFEMEYHHRSKSNPFSEKWINCTRSRTRVQRLKDFLYEHIDTILTLGNPETFFQHTLSQFMHRDYQEFRQISHNVPIKADKDPLYYLIYIKLTLEELFVVLTMVIMWEHQSYPTILEAHIREKLVDKQEAHIRENYLKYYVRFLDVLSSPEIISLFDLDALKNTLRLDRKIIDDKPLESLYLFKDWPVFEKQSFDLRFPSFKHNIEKYTAPNLQVSWI